VSKEFQSSSAAGKGTISERRAGAGLTRLKLIIHPYVFDFDLLSFDRVERALLPAAFDFDFWTSTKTPANTNGASPKGPAPLLFTLRY
jgi:hypothetical protein